MKLLRKTLVVATLTWLPIVVSCAIVLQSGDFITCVWRALPAWPVLFVVLLPMMGIGDLLAEARTPTPVPVRARTPHAGR